MNRPARPPRLLVAVANALGWAADKILTRCFASCPDDLLTNAEFARKLVAQHEADLLATEFRGQIEAWGGEVQ